MLPNNLSIKKYDLKSPSMKDITCGIIEAFENPDLYFRRTIKENKIIVGKRLSPFKEEELKREIILPINDSTLSPTMKSKYMKLCIKSKDLSKSTERLCTRATGKSMISSLRHNKPGAYEQKRNISDEELNQLFDRYSQIQERNSSYSNDFNKQFEEKHFKTILKLQEDILKRNDLNSKALSLLEEQLQKKSKKTKNELLANRISSFRILQEMRDSNNELKSVNSCIKDHWQMNLRCEKDFKGMKQIWVNSRSNSNPKWSLIYQKVPTIKEKVRNVLRNGHPEEKSFLNNPYLKEKSNYHSLRNSFDELQGLSIQGKNLLASEIEYSKEIKGKKKILLMPALNKELKITKEIARDFSLNNIFKVKTINSCRMLHNPIQYNGD